MTVRVKLFGPEARAAGAGEVFVTVAGNTCGALRTALGAFAPVLQPFLNNARFAVNHDFANDDQTISESDEIALIGMVSGG